MDHNLYNWVICPIIAGVWLYMAISAIRTFLGLTKTHGLSSFMGRRDLKDPVVAEGVRAWKSKIKRLFLLWIITVVGFMILSAVIGNTIGFKN
jgi:hypothetical protein